METVIVCVINIVIKLVAMFLVFPFYYGLFVIFVKSWNFTMYIIYITSKSDKIEIILGTLISNKQRNGIHIIRKKCISHFSAEYIKLLNFKFPNLN